MRLLIFILILLITLPVYADGWQDRFDIQDNTTSFVDIVPPKGYTGRYVHILFDQSGSMNVQKHRVALQQLSMTIGWGVDEFYVKVTAFGKNFTTLVPNKVNGFNVSKDNTTWMTFPSRQNTDKILEWLGQKRVSDDATNFTGAVNSALREGIEDLTITIVSDCIMDDNDEFAQLVGELQVPIRIIFAVIPPGNFQHWKTEELYNFCKTNGLYWINVRDNGY